MSQFTDEDLASRRSPFTEDPLDFLIKEFTRKGMELEEQMTETRRERQEQKAARKKEKESGNGESEDVSMSNDEDL